MTPGAAETEAPASARPGAAAANKQRAYRRRQAAGLAVLGVPVRHFEFVDGLIAAGRLGVEEALDRRLVEREAAEILAEWARRWRMGR